MLRRAVRVCKDGIVLTGESAGGHLTTGIRRDDGAAFVGVEPASFTSAVADEVRCWLRLGRHPAAVVVMVADSRTTALEIETRADMSSTSDSHAVRIVPWYSPAGPPKAYSLGPRNRRRFRSCASRPFGSKGIRRDSVSLACSAGMLI